MKTETKNRILWIIVVIWIGILIAILTSCKKDSDGFNIYRVPANQHYKKGWKVYPKKVGQSSLDFSFKVDESWIWNDQYPAGVTGWSKIRGLTWGHHEENSCVILAYRYNDIYCIIGGYARADGVDASDDPQMAGIIDTVQVGDVIHCRLSLSGGRYYINVNGKEWSCRAGKEIDWGYKLNPYVGGDYLIRHEWRVTILDD